MRRWESDGIYLGVGEGSFSGREDYE